MHAILGLLLAMVAAVAAFSNSDFFIRSAKWIPSGGAGLVSGRGNFRPGFTGRDWRSAMAEPNFNKRSAQPWFSEDY
ncbi:hypothetical protein RB195_000371 [Necator americanus]|uniref:Uncharacterized protein n=2 Tax=Necator americanus TaxID=51031 RepID=W2T109_NECAM|nr:hypothetical protein NECAME_12618 [Necator americanus]ETN74921.1 hypothetical protein NECAME_12618 [Necator americanus]